jgi:integrase
MRGHIVKRANDSYSIVLSLGIDPTTGKRKRQWVSVKGTKKEAEKRLAEMLHQIDTGFFIKPDKTLFSDYLKTWLIDYVKPNLSPRGYERYDGIVNKSIIPAFNNITLIQLKPEHLQKYYNRMLEKGLSPRTVRYHHSVIHKSLKMAMKRGYLNHNVADAVEMPKIKRNEMQVWNEVEINKFLESAKTSPYYELFNLALFTGMRRSELLGLQWKDIDLVFGQISVNKGLHHLKDGSYVFTQTKSEKSRRTIALAPSTCLMLKTLWERRVSESLLFGTTEDDDGLLSKTKVNDDSLLFSFPDGKPLRPNTITRAWENQAIKAGVKVIRLHDARHTHASIMLKQGIHPKIVQERLGHSSVTGRLKPATWGRFKSGHFGR